MIVFEAKVFYNPGKYYWFPMCLLQYVALIDSFAFLIELIY